jgi:hypothetical protein
VRCHIAAVVLRDLHVADNLAAVLRVPTTTTRDEPHAIAVWTGRGLTRRPWLALRSGWTCWPGLTWCTLRPAKQIELSGSDVRSTNATARRECHHSEQSSYGPQFAHGSGYES